MKTLDYQIHGNVALIAMENPPVNALGYALRCALVEAFDRAMADPAVDAVVLAGSERAFSGGADIVEFSAGPGEPDAFTEPNMHTVTELIEACEKPVVAAVAGICMGGGLELALACHFRVGQTGAQVSLPEINLGLIPGAGGTQRLPRLIGVEPALNLMLGGKPMPSGALAASGLFNFFVDADVNGAALGFASRLVAEGKGPRRLSAEKISYPYAEPYFQFVRNNLARASKNYPAPLRCVDSVAAAVSSSFKRGQAQEWESFRTLLETSVSKALRHGFFAERAAAKVDGLQADTPTRKVEQVAVIGAGTMGGGITMAFVNAGIPVRLLEMNSEALEAGLVRIRASWEGTAKRSGMTAEEIDARMAQITPALNYSEIAEADLVIEAVFEDLAVKQAVFAELGKVMRSGAILASNTSTLDVDLIAQASGRPADVLGLHFFSPAQIMKLLEVVRGAETAPDVLATAMALAKRIRKTAVVSRVCDGFIGNRMLNEYLNAAFRLIEQGVSPYAIDKALESWGMAMGPFRMLDMAGNDVHWAVRKQQARQYADYRPAVIADRLCEMGRFGQKTGRGWYIHAPGQRRAEQDPEVNALIEEHCKAEGITPRNVPADQIVEKLIYALVNEGALLLEEGIAQRASDIDVVYLAGYGFPAFRGGPMFYADQIGLYNVARSLRGEEGGTGPAPLIAELAADGRSLT